MLAYSHTFFSCCILALVPHAAAVRLSEQRVTPRFPHCLSPLRERPFLSGFPFNLSLFSSLWGQPSPPEGKTHRLSVRSLFFSLNLEGGSLLI